jgi:hypothetical protein
MNFRTAENDHCARTSNEPRRNRLERDWRQRRTAPVSAAGARLDRWSENHCAANRATSSASIVVKTISPNRRDCPDTREAPQKLHVSCPAPIARPQRGQVFSRISLHAPTAGRLEKALDRTGNVPPLW